MAFAGHRRTCSPVALLLLLCVAGPFAASFFGADVRVDAAKDDTAPYNPSLRHPGSAVNKSSPALPHEEAPEGTLGVPTGTSPNPDSLVGTTAKYFRQGVGAVSSGLGYLAHQAGRGFSFVKGKVSGAAPSTTPEQGNGQETTSSKSAEDGSTDS